MKKTITEYWRAGLNWDREVEVEMHPYYNMAFYLAGKWLREAAAGHIPTYDEPSSPTDYTVAERPGRND